MGFVASVFFFAMVSVVGFAVNGLDELLEKSQAGGVALFVPDMCQWGIQMPIKECGIERPLNR